VQNTHPIYTFIEIRDDPMKKRVTIIILVSVLFLMCHCSDKATASYPFSRSEAKKIFSAKSSASSAPGPLKQQTGSQPARPYAPVQQNKK